MRILMISVCHVIKKTLLLHGVIIPYGHLLSDQEFDGILLELSSLQMPLYNPSHT